MKVSKPALDRFKSWLHVQFDDELRPNRTLMLQFEYKRTREDTVDDENSFDIQQFHEICIYRKDYSKQWC